MSNINEMNVGPRWYVAHTYSGYESKVKANLEKIVENRGLQNMIFDVRIPTETVVEKTEKEEKEIERKLFPSYVLVKMVMNDESWHIIRNTTGVTGFVGPGSRPVPLTEAEVETPICPCKTKVLAGKKIGVVVYCDEDKQQQVRDFITEANRTLPLYKRMSAVEFSTEPLPRNGAGKLLRQ